MLKPVKVRGDAAVMIKALHDAGARFVMVQKRSSRWMRFLGWAYSILGQDFNKYITTIGATVYWNSDEARSIYDAAAIYHESIHVHDYRANPFWFVFSYLLPQILAPLFWIGGGVSAIWIGWWSLFIVALGVVMLFLPSVTRTHWELRGYAGSLGVRAQFGIHIDREDTDRYAKIRFASSAYMWMCPDWKWVSKKLLDLVGKRQTLPNWDAAAKAVSEILQSRRERSHG